MRTLTTFSRSLFAFCVAALLAAGCTDKEETREIDFSLSRYSVAFAVGGGTTSLTVGTSDSWSASTDATWLTLGQSGSTLSITAEANDVTTEVREADVTVTTSSYGSATVQVRQEPAEGVSLSINYGTAEPKIDSEGGTYTVTVECSGEWTASLSEDISWWDVTADTDAGTVTVTAGANSGSSVTGTVNVVATHGGETVSEQFAVTQISRDENPYYQFLGDWDVSAGDCMVSDEWAGKAGVYTSCTFEEYNYSTEAVSLCNWGELIGLRNDNLEYDAEPRAVTMALGYLAGTMTSGYITYYMYLVSFNPAVTGFSTANHLVFTISEDGTSIEVSGPTEDFPIIGWVGYNPYIGYVKVNNVPYCQIPLSLTKSSGSTSSLSLTDSAAAFAPVDELPEGVPARLPKGMTGTVLSSIVL